MIRNTVAGAMALCGVFSATADSFTNVLIIMADDMRVADRLPGVETPNIDRIKAMGMAFSNVHCQTPLCNPSRVSLMTGLRPDHTGIYVNDPWFRNVSALKTRKTLSDAFKAGGYNVMGAGKIYHYFNAPQQAEFPVNGPAAEYGPYPSEKLNGYIVDAPIIDWGAWPPDERDSSDWKVATWSAGQIRTAGSEKPFFLMCGFIRPHLPFFAPPEWIEKFPLETIKPPPLHEGDIDDLSEFARRMSYVWHWEPHEWFAEPHRYKTILQAYYAATAFSDHQIGRVLDALEQSGQQENTIVVFLSDHGFFLGEKERFSKYALWDIATRPPLIIAGPGIKGGTVCDEPVELLDLFPTLAELCSVSCPQDLDGHSLGPQLCNPKTPRTYPAITTMRPDNHAVTTRRYRYIRYETGDEELYDRLNDPEEINNLASNPEYRSIMDRLARWLPESCPYAKGSSDGRRIISAAEFRERTTAK